MTTKRMTTLQKATALVPLALLSGAWTASLAVTSATAADSEDTQKLPDGTTMPTETVEQPANITAPGEIAPGVPKGSEDEVLQSASTNGIPAAALSAYQRAAQVISTADPSCKLEWPLVAAIGRVESDHGRYGGNVLNAEGVSRPGIFGIPLDGSNGTQRISDTDAGQYDNDKTFDRAVGAMQFIPSTWSVVGVDGDGDGQRNPQDIDDSALATAVYLCSGDEDLSTRSGQEAAVFRYNHSDDYVSLVLSIMNTYASGDYSAVPTSSSGTTTFTPSYGDSVFGDGTSGYQPPKGSSNGGTSGGTTSGTGGSGDIQDPGTGTPSEEPPSEQPPTEAPPTGGTGTGGTPDVGGAVEGTVKDTEETVEEVLITASQAASLCTGELQAQFGDAPQEAVSQCASALSGMTMAEAQNAVGGIVAGLESLVEDLVGGLPGLGG
jgi:membrane-bound lytic murein transglycosylase B